MTCKTKHHQLPCSDCSEPTSIKGQKSEYYMVKFNVWKQANPAERADFLCIGCLEARLGRTLTPEDFALVPLNFISKDKQSDRLLDRMGYFRDDKNLRSKAMNFFHEINRKRRKADSNEQ